MNKRLLVEELPVGEALLPWTTEAERQTAAAFTADRRREYLAWRALVRRELGDVVIGYNAVGAPVLPDYSQIHIGVSHGAGRVAVCFSDRVCAVDIESIGRDFGRIESRYLAPQEAKLSSDPRYQAVAWCAKECLYKLSGQRQLNLLTDLRITAAGADWVEGCIKNGEPRRLSVLFEEDAVVVWTL